MSWDKLSLRERAEYIKTGVRNGLTTIDDIKEAYNKFDESGYKGETSYSAGHLTDAIYNNSRVESLGEPSHHYDFTQSEEWANAHGYYPDARGHRDDRVKKESHPTHPSRGTWKSPYQFELSDKGMQDPNYILFGLADGGQDPQATMTYNGDIVLPEITVTPKGNYIYNPYDNINIYKDDLGNIDYTSALNNEYGLGGLIAIPSAGLMSALTSGINKVKDVFGLQKSTPPQKKRKVIVTPSKKEDIKPITYTVKSGDTLTKIAKENNVKLEDILKYNKDIKNPNVIATGQNIQLSPSKTGVKWRNVKEFDNERNLSNMEAIQSVKHDGNYVIIDKANSLLQVFDSDNKLLYKTNQINTGASKNDYNTITYVDKSGNIRNMQGNNSTPAGITEITGVGNYHGVPSFTRGRYKGNTQELEDIASSLHYGIIAKGKGSNGCVRVGGKQLTELSNFLGVGTKVYTLPEKGGSKFTVSQGKLNYTADNPYGKDTKGDKKRFWDDYNVHTDKTYSPLRIDIRDYDGSEYANNRLKFASTLARNKESLQRELGLSSATYNNLTQLALGIAEQETKFNTSTRKKIKDELGDFAISALKTLSARKPGARSYGYTQIKLDGDNRELQDLYKKYNISKDNINNADKSAIATLLRLYSIYKNEVVGRNFRGADGNQIDSYDALLYKWMGKNKELTNHTATPNQNRYIKNVNRYKNNFDYYVGE